MQNDSYTAEKFYDDLYERNESPSMKECPECKGSGQYLLSDCCGAEILNITTCTDCGGYCYAVVEKCETCDGEGEVEG